MMDNPIRVLQVFASLDRGGAETMVMNIYRQIDRSKVQFDFIANENNGEYAYESEIKKLGGRIYKIPRYNISNYIAYKKKWINLLNEHKEWKIIHGHHTTPAFIYLAIAKKDNRIAIAHSHTSGFDDTIKSKIKVLLRSSIEDNADHLFACSDKAALWMYGENQKKVTIIKNAIQSDVFVYNSNIRKIIRQEFNIDDKFVIGHVGRFTREKNHDFLIQIFLKVLKKNDNAVLLLVGDGKLKRTMEKKVKELGLIENVIFTGIRADIPEMLNAMDVFLFPSLYEGLPVTIIEAQASGLKCIISDTITDEVKITDLVESISLGDQPEYWAKQVLKYADGYERKDTYKEICDAGYDVKENAKWLEKFYLGEYKK